MLITLSNLPSSYTHKNLGKLIDFIKGLAQITDRQFQIDYEPTQHQWMADAHNQKEWQYDVAFHNSSYSLCLENQKYALYLKYEESPEEHREGATFRFDWMGFEVKGLPEGAKLIGKIRKDTPYQLSLEVITYDTKHEAIRQYLASSEL